MKNIFTFFIIIILSSFTSVAQINKVQISSKKVNEHGINFYLHTVQKGETLYRIAKAYQVDINDILYFNPSLFNSGIKEGEIIKIPEIRNDAHYYYHLVKKGETIFSICRKYKITENQLFTANPEIKTEGLKEATIIKIPKNNFQTPQKEFERQPQPQTKYITHIVKPHETLYGLAKKYNVTIQEILDANPFLKDQGLKKDVAIKIPVPAQQQEQVETPKQHTTTPKYIEHNVQPKETLYSLAQKYGVHINDIIKANPQVAQEGLKTGTTIKIPTKQSQLFPTITNQPNKDTIAPAHLADSLLLAMDTVFNKKQCDTSSFATKEINVLLALPFENVDIKNNPQLDYSDVKTFKNYPIVEFYEGFLVALDSIKKEGLTINLKVFDSGDTSNINSYLASYNQPDIIFFYGTQQQTVSVTSQANHYGIPLIDVFGARDGVSFPNYVRLIANKQEKKQALINLISKLDTANIIFLYNPTDSFAIKVIGKVKNTMLNNPNVTIKTGQLNEKEIKNIEDYISIAKENYIVIWNFDEPQVVKYVSKLALVVAKHKIDKLHLIMLPEWKNYKWDYEYLHRLQSLSIVQTFIPQGDSIFKAFAIKFKGLYNNIPTKFSLWGFDVGYYFSRSYALFGENIWQCIKSYEPKLMETKFRIVKTNNYHNSFFYVVEYKKDYSTVVKNNGL